MDSDFVGGSFAHFQIVSKVGEGGMGVVYRAIDRKLERTVALKVIPEAFASDPERRQRLLREARAAAAVVHANVATVFEVGEVGGRVFLSMELVEGQSLRERIRAGIGMKEALRIARAMAEGLGRAHVKGVVHRDLKPENVMVTALGDVKILDFGIAKIDATITHAALGDAPTDALLTLDGHVMGTPAYMSPEQARSEPVDARSDVFSFGIVLYEMLAGQRPFLADNVIALLLAATTTPHRPVASLNPEVTPEIEQIVGRCLAKEPQARYANGLEIADALAPFVTGPVPSMPREPRSEPSVATSLPAPSGGTTVRPPPRRPHGALLGLAGLVLLGAAIVIARVAARAPKAVLVTPSATATVTAPPRGFTDAPISPTKSDVARAKFREAMAHVAAGDGDEAAMDALDEALAADPKLASAALQRSYLASAGDALNDAERRTFLVALAHKSELSASERDLLDAIAPLFGDPHDLLESAKRFRAYVAAWPSDAEGWDGLGTVLAKLEDPGAPEAFAREAALAPTEVEGHQVWAQSLVELGRPTEAETVLDDCVRRQPAAIPCLTQAAALAARAGDCKKMDANARAMTAAQDLGGWHYRAIASAGMGASDEAITELLTTLESRVPPGSKPRAHRRLVSTMAWRRGDLAAYLRENDAAEAVIPNDDRTIDDSAKYAFKRATVLWEMGDVAGSARAAKAFLDRLPALPTPEGTTEDPQGELLSIAHHAGVIDLDVWHTQRDAWIARRRASLPEHAWPNERTTVWAAAFYPPDEPTKAEADDALAALTALGGEPGPVDPLAPLPDAMGALLLGEGQLADAGAWLTVAVRRCSLEQPVRAMYLLGRVQEEQHDTAAACRSYADVMRTWPHPVPRSVSVERARARAKKMGCPGVPSR